MARPFGGETGGLMTVSGHDWSHPSNYAEAKARLIGRQRLNRKRQRFAGQLCDEVIWPLLLRYGLFEWGTLTRVAQEIGVHKSTVCRHRARILKGMLGQ
jgi:hypothetical protein